MTEDFDPAELGSMSQEELNSRILAATLKQGSRSGEQAMLAQQLQLGGGGARKLGPRGRGIIGEINDAFGAAAPGMAQGKAQQMMTAQRAADQKFMADLLRRGGKKPGMMTGANPLGGPIESADPWNEPKYGSGTEKRDPFNPYGEFPPGY
jgi:hypothetical protein